MLVLVRIYMALNRDNPLNKEFACKGKFEIKSVTLEQKPERTRICARYLESAFDHEVEGP